GMSDEFTLPDGERVDFSWHALRRTFASLLSDAGAPGEAIDYLLGQSPRTTRGRHYTAPPMNELARAVALLVLTLPERSGVPSSAAPSPEESSFESSQPPGEPDKDQEEQATVSNTWRSGRVVEGSGFENRRTRKGTRGSNPFSSAEVNRLHRRAGARGVPPHGHAHHAVSAPGCTRYRVLLPRHGHADHGLSVVDSRGCRARLTDDGPALPA